MTIEAELQELVNAFAADVARLARKAAMETVSELLTTVGTTASSSHGAPARPVGRPSAASASSSSSSTAGQRKTRGGKRAADDLATLQQRLRDHVRSHPGQRVTDINAALGTATGDLRLPLTKLVQSGELRTTGQKRATAYYPG